MASLATMAELDLSRRRAGKPSRELVVAGSPVALLGPVRFVSPERQLCIGHGGRIPPVAARMSRSDV